MPVVGRSLGEVGVLAGRGSSPPRTVGLEWSEPLRDGRRKRWSRSGNGWRSASGSACGCLSRTELTLAPRLRGDRRSVLDSRRKAEANPATKPLAGGEGGSFWGRGVAATRESTDRDLRRAWGGLCAGWMSWKAAEKEPGWWMSSGGSWGGGGISTDGTAIHSALAPMPAPSIVLLTVKSHVPRPSSRSPPPERRRAPGPPRVSLRPRPLPPSH
jgi:hypothetical protein